MSEKPPIPDRNGQVWVAKKDWRVSPITLLRPIKLLFWVHRAEAKDWRGRKFEFTIGETVLKREYKREKR